MQYIFNDFRLLRYLYFFILCSHRRRREYLTLDFEQILAEKGINSNLIMPRHQSSSDEHVTIPDSPMPPYLPLEVSLLLLHLPITFTSHILGHSATPHSSFLCFSLRYLTMRSMTAGLQKTGLPWAMLDHLIENLFLQKPCCLQTTRLLLVKCPQKYTV